MSSNALSTPATRAQLRYVIDMVSALNNVSDFELAAHVTDPNILGTIYDIVEINGDLKLLFIPFSEVNIAIKTLRPLYQQFVQHMTLCRDAQQSSSRSSLRLILTDLLNLINPGRYALIRTKDNGVDFFEVIEHDNHRYINQLLGGSDGKTKFRRKYLELDIQITAAKVILDDQRASALLYADTYHECPRCGVALTHPRSIKARIGKSCALIWGWDW